LYGDVDWGQLLPGAKRSQEPRGNRWGMFRKEVGGLCVGSIEGPWGGKVFLGGKGKGQGKDRRQIVQTGKKGGIKNRKKV